MKASQGKANPQAVNKILREKLGKLLLMPCLIIIEARFFVITLSNYEG